MVKLNKSETKWLVILLGFTGFIYKLLFTGKIYYFIHPKMINYVKFSFIVFFLLSALQITKIFSAENKRKVSLYAFLFPLILGLCFNPQQLNSETAAKKGVSILQSNLKTKDVSQKQNIIASGDLIIDSSNFSSMMDDITYSNPDKYKGKNVTIKGFIYRDGTFLKNEFVIARQMMICCAADTAVVGLLCDLENTATLKNNDWFVVTGIMDTKIHKYEGKEQVIPFIKVEKVEATEKPKNQYVYPE